MAVFRVEKTSNFTVMSNYHLRDKSLSLKAKGLLSQMLSLPEDWDYTLTGLSYINRESKDAIRTAINELERAGYIERRQTTDERGKFACNEYIIHESPVKRDPVTQDTTEKADDAATAETGEAQEPEQELTESNTENAMTEELEPKEQETQEPKPQNQRKKLRGKQSRKHQPRKRRKQTQTAPLSENPTTEKVTPALSPSQDSSLSAPPLENPTTDQDAEGSFFCRPLLDFPTTENPSTENPSPENPTQLNKDKRNKEKQNKDLSSTDSFFPSAPVLEKAATKEDVSAKREEIREQIEYDLIVDYGNQDQINEFVEIMLEVALSRSPNIRIGRDKTYPTAFVQQRFDQLNAEHIRQVLDGIRGNTTRVWNTRAYLLAALFNAPSTIGNYYTMLVNHDFATGV